MRLGTRITRWRRDLALALDPSVAAQVAPEIVRVLPGSVRGVERATRRADEIYRRFQIERGRFEGYRDAWTFIQEMPLAEAAVWNLAQDATAEPFHIECSDRIAERELNELFQRINYAGEMRTEFLACNSATGDLFLFVDKDIAPISRRRLAEITGLRVPPEYTMFRLGTAQGAIADPGRAYMQLPGIDLVENSFGGSILRVGGKLYSDRKLETRGLGFAGITSDYTFQNLTDERLYFAAEDVIHARRRPRWQPVRSGYGVGVFRSTGRILNALHGSWIDMVVGRQLETMNRLHHDVDPTVGKEEFEAYKKWVEENPPTPAQQYVTKGVKITAVDAKNAGLRNFEDLDLTIEMGELGIGYALMLAGFRAGRYSGEILAQVIQWLNRAIRIEQQHEEYAIIRPLGDRQLWYRGKAGVKWDVVFPLTSLEDSNKRSKRLLSEVAAGSLSRRSCYRVLHQATDAEWEQEMAWIEEETRRIGPVGGRYSAPGESLNKGVKGVETVDPAAQDIGDIEGTS